MSTAARRYAEALLEVVWREDAETRAASAEELRRLAETIRGVFDLRNALENPSYALEDRLRALDAVAARLELSDRVVTFARLLVERGRAAEIGEIAETYRRLLDERSGRVRALVTSARPLDEAATQAIRHALERRTGKTVELEAAVDPSLIGGVRAQVGTIVYDGTIRAELDRLRENLDGA